MDKKTLLSFIDRYITGQSDKIENQKLSEFYESYEHNNDAQAHMRENKDLETNILNKIQFSISNKPPITPVVRLFKRSQLVAASLLFIGFSTATYLYFNPTTNAEVLAKISNKTKADDLNPAKNMAVLTLANHTQILLDESSNGEIAVESGISITKTANGELVYKVKNSLKKQGNETPKFNTITTPKGGKFNVLLPDGSLVMLNAASSLTYPIYFSKNERRVNFTGEAYFEIAKQTDHNHKRIPFFVQSKEQVVEVLGTHFNINSYDNEDYVKTTLLEGSVKVINIESKKEPKFLKPGQQAITKIGSEETKIIKADAGQTVAWKDGYFMFKNSNIKEIANELERWYDVEIDYSEQMAFDNITGYIARNVKISNVLRMLELSGIVSYEIKGRKIILKAS